MSLRNSTSEGMAIPYSPIRKASSATFMSVATTPPIEAVMEQQVLSLLRNHPIEEVQQRYQSTSEEIEKKKQELRKLVG